MLTKSSFVFFVSVICVASAVPWVPEPKNETGWMHHHERLLNRTAEHAAEVKVLFLGASIMEFWQTNGRAVYEKHYKPLGTFDYGIAGDRTEHLLWRMKNGEMKGIHAKVAVLEIGLNNIWKKDKPKEIAKGNEAIIKLLAQTQPGIKTILVSLLPVYNGTHVNVVLDEINVELKKLADGHNVHWLYLNEYFLPKSEGGVEKDPVDLYQPDHIHPTEKGYQLWSNHMEKLVHKLLGKH